MFIDISLTYLGVEIPKYQFRRQDANLTSSSEARTNQGTLYQALPHTTKLFFYFTFTFMLTILRYPSKVLKY
uniref:Uncharacterized protein n=1 Tax=Megaselia scalaris TaxID=36166 RepID=T1H211_MEGSC